MNNLFSPVYLTKTVKLKNRLSVAPMTTQQSNPDGSLGEAEENWLNRLAEDGYGMVITCAVSVSDTATAFYNQLSLAHDHFIPALQKLTTEMKQNETLSIVQLCHAGSRTIEKLTGVPPTSASSYQLPIPGFVPPEELTLEQIKQLVQEFASACERAEKSGFDGAELHGANGYLFTQFISRMTNLRNDEYGGSLENRARFSREVVRACRSRVSENFIIGFRMSFEGAGLETGLDLDENIQIANWLAEDGINYIHSSQLNFRDCSVKYPEQVILKYLRTQLDSSLLLVGAGSIVSAEDAEEMMHFGVDIVAVGRAAIGNRFLPEVFKNREVLENNMPFSVEKLVKTGISPQFIDYLLNAPPLASLHIVER